MRKFIRIVLAILAAPAFIAFGLLGWILPPLCLFAFLGVATLIKESFKYCLFEMTPRQREHCKEEIYESLFMTTFTFWMALDGFLYILKGKE